MQTLSQIRDLLAQRGVRPKHRFGQNFLHDQNQLRKLVAAANVQPGDLVLEVGPGTGTLTETLLEAGADVIACEIDPDMAAIIREHVAPRHAHDESSNRGVPSPHLTLIEADILAGKHAIAPEVVAHLDRPFKLVANLPYQVASPLISSLLVEHSDATAQRAASSPTRDRAFCTGLFITVQREAAERILSGPRTKEYGVLAVLCQTFAEVELISRLSPGCFWPAPKVESAMIAFRPRPSPAIADRRAFAAFLQTLFRSRRKQLGSIFGRDRAWPAGIQPTQRPGELTIGQVGRLFLAGFGETTPIV
ncbi:MAG: ribosomal RNA small subunit methyltransferase A [Phycisphaerales bacterium]|nr:ribosomal RNA small subunit methyltransferase A [Phycisphaerales bacterium]